MDCGAQMLMLALTLAPRPIQVDRGSQFGPASSAGGGTRTPDTRIMMGDTQGSDGSEKHSQARRDALSSAGADELGARSGARRKRKKRKG